MQNPKDISNPTTALDMALELMAKAFQLNNTTPTNNNQISSSKTLIKVQIAQFGMNKDKIDHILMVDDNVGNQFRQNAVQNVGHLNPNGNCNVVAARSKGNTNRNNGNQIRLLRKKKQGSNLILRNLIHRTAAGVYDEIEEVNVNCTLKDNLQ
ncbi:hypothetical protein Tco_1245308 [Tanacetum coccineum]